MNLHETCVGNNNNFFQYKRSLGGRKLVLIYNRNLPHVSWMITTSSHPDIRNISMPNETSKMRWQARNKHEKVYIFERTKQPELIANEILQCRWTPSYSGGVLESAVFYVEWPETSVFTTKYLPRWAYVLLRTQKRLCVQKSKLFVIRWLWDVTKALHCRSFVLFNRELCSHKRTQNV